MSLSRNASYIFIVSGALLLGGLGLLLGFFEILALVDPVGTKLADDSDPLGDPYISPIQHAVWISITLGLLAISVWMFSRANKLFPENK